MDARHWALVICWVAAWTGHAAQALAASSAPAARSDGRGLEIRLRSDRPGDVFWGEEPVRLTLQLVPRTQTRLDGVRWEIRLTDLDTGRPAANRSGRVDLAAGKTVRLGVSFGSLRKGVLRADARAMSAAGQVLGSCQRRIGNYLPSVPESMRAALDVGWVGRSPFGGVFRPSDGRLADLHGLRWCQVPCGWRDGPPEIVQHDEAGWGERLNRLRRNRIHAVAAIAPLARATSSRPVPNAAEAPSFGRSVYGMVRESHHACCAWELDCGGGGQVDAVCPGALRHGAAAIRRVDPLALVIAGGVSLTRAGRDLSVYEDHAFADIDVTCVRTTVGLTSPQRTHLVGRHNAVRGVIDSLGGWHDVWAMATVAPVRNDRGESWSDSRQAVRRFVKHRLLTLSAGIERHGLSNADALVRQPSLAAAADHTLISLLEGHRYVGPLRSLGEGGVCLLVFERNGRATLVGWRDRPAKPDRAGLRMDLDTIQLRRYDLTGNSEALLNASGEFGLALTESPQYWVGVGRRVVAQASGARLEQAVGDLTRLARRAGATDLLRWAQGLANLSRPSPLEARLKALPRSVIPAAAKQDPAHVAAMCQALRVAGLLAHFAEASTPPSTRVLEPETFSLETQRSLEAVRRRVELLTQGYEQMHRRDHTVGVLRWIIRHARRVLDDAETARRYARYRRVTLLTDAAEAYVAAGATVFNKHRPVTRSVWITPLKDPTSPPGRALRAVPGRPLTLRFRVDAYPLRSHRGALVVVLPSGWTVAEKDGVVWREKRAAGRPVRLARDIRINPLVHQTVALTVTPPAKTEAREVRLSVQLDVATLSVPPVDVDVEIRPPAP